MAIINFLLLKKSKDLPRKVVQVSPFIKHMRVMYPQGACESLIWGNKVSCEFRAKVLSIATNLWGEDKKVEMANNLMAVFAWESGGTFKSNAPNIAGSGATGLIQFMPSTAKGLLGKEVTIETVTNYWGQNKTLTRVKEFADMSELKQLDYVEKYFKPLKGKDVEFVDFYLQVLFPASSGKPEHVVFSEKGDGLDKNDIHYKKRISSYNQNAGMDSNKDGKIWKSEIEEDVSKYLRNGEKYRNDCLKGNCSINEGNESEIDNGVTLHFTGATAQESSLSIKTKNILKEVGKSTGNNNIYITSVARTAYDQARIMYDNCNKNLQEQKNTYAAPGLKVIKVFEDNKSKTRKDVISLMENKIKELGPPNVSKHCSDPEVLNTFDVSYTQLSDKQKFWGVISKRPELDKILNENKYYHIQITQ